jgi:phosphohistidine phosphatase SixA
MIGPTRRRFVAAGMALAAAPTAAAGGWAALRRPGAVAVMRHARAPGTGDPADFTLGDCSTQRNLDGRGRAQARAIGAAFRDRGIGVDAVYTSQWCRCRETAALLELGEPQDLPALNSFFADRSTRDAQTRAVRAFLADRPAEARLVLVTHFVNIRALTGRGVRSGEIVVIDTDAEGDVQVLGEIRISA